MLDENIDGAQSILVERIAEDPQLVGSLREWLWRDGRIVSKIAKDKHTEAIKFTDYFDYQQLMSEVADRIKDVIGIEECDPTKKHLIKVSSNDEVFRLLLHDDNNPNREQKE